MGDLRGFASVVVAAIGLALLAGCAVRPAALPDVTATAPTSAAATPTSGPTTDAGGDAPPQYSLNERHHERGDVAAGSQASLDAARAQVDRDLAELQRPVAQDAVEGVLDDAGAPDPWIVTYPADGTVVFEAQVATAGCLVGRVPPAGRAEVHTAGWVADGGCHALDGH